MKFILLILLLFSLVIYVLPIKEKRAIENVDHGINPCIWIGDHWVECGPEPGERECRQNLHTLPKDYLNRNELCIR